jgi:hypothetical protein
MMLNRFNMLRQNWVENRKPYLRSIWREKSVPVFVFLLEFAILIVVTLAATGSYLDNNSQTQLPGREAEWLTSTSLVATEAYQEYGYIPTWNPYYEWGEPLVSNPFASILNPISMFPVWFFGHVQGVKISIVLYTLLAGFGGWYLGYALGFSSVGRVMLGILMIGKGPMHANIMAGYYQLGVSQAYMPWVFGAAIHTLRSKRTFPVVLTALSVTLMFYAGNIWHVLPTIFALLLLTFSHLNFPKTGEDNWNKQGIMRLVFAGVLSIGLSAATLFPIWAYQGSIGGHKGEIDAGWVMPREDAFAGYFDSSPERVEALEIFVPAGEETVSGDLHFYYSYVIPLWFVVLIFIIIPPIYPLSHIPSIAQSWRIWGLGLFMFFFATFWAMGGTVFFKGLYEYVPFIAQWRFVGRAFATSSFWLAVIIAMRVDALWRSLHPYIAKAPQQWRYGFFYTLAIFIFLFANIAAFDSVRFWRGERNVLHTVPITSPEANCLAWLRRTNPNDEFNVWFQGYATVRPFIENKIRLVNIEADFVPIELTPTIGAPNLGLVGIDAAYVLSPQGAYRTYYVEESGYQPVENAPLINNSPCIFYNSDYDAPYAAWITVSALEQLWDDRLAVFEQMRPVIDYKRLYDRIYLTAQASSSQERVVTIQERAFPGWRVYIDGQAADLEVIGGWVGVRLPADNEQYQVYFVYAPIWLGIGIWVTLFTALVAALYLIMPKRLTRWGSLFYLQVSTRSIAYIREHTPFPDEEDIEEGETMDSEIE